MLLNSLVQLEGKLLISTGLTAVPLVMDGSSSGFSFNNSFSFSKYLFLNLRAVGSDMLFLSNFEKCLDTRVGPFSAAYILEMYRFTDSDRQPIQ